MKQDTQPKSKGFTNAQVLALAAQCPAAAYYTKWVIVVDEDVDPTDLLRALSGVCLAADEPGWQAQACRICSLLMDGLRYQVTPAAR